MPDCNSSPLQHAHFHTAPYAAWQARLNLGFLRETDTTRLTRREHEGPIRVQKALYPEHPSVCHAIVVHPPGGMAGGDQLNIEADIGPGAHALLTTPGAAKWYRANGRTSGQEIVFNIGAGATLEWMPQESIFFDQTEARIGQRVVLDAGARFLGCEIICLGRQASGERFTSGTIRQQTSVTRMDRLLWWEQGCLTPKLAESPLGLVGHSVCATLIAAGAPLPPSLLTDLRALSAELWFGASQIQEVLTVRYLGNDSEAARELMLAAWRLLRPALLEREPCELRSWRT